MNKFPLSSEQLQLLIAFSEANGLLDLSDRLAKDSSVISRRLQQLAMTAPVIAKVSNKWQITPLGTEVCTVANQFAAQLNTLLNAKKIIPKRFSPRTALLLINVQQGLLSGKLRQSIQPALTNIVHLLSFWRQQCLPIVHIRHVSDNPNSNFYSYSDKVAILADVKPADSERIIDKHFACAFKETKLEQHLNDLTIEDVVIVGFTGNECIDATARGAAEYGFGTTVISDGLASFGVYDFNGEFYNAERVHKLMLLNLSAICAEVLSTQQLMSFHFSGS